MDTRWLKRAACRGMDTNIFFPVKGASTAPAKEICARCPVREECYQDSLVAATGRHTGIWGGLTVAERRTRRRRERRAKAQRS